MKILLNRNALPIMFVLTTVLISSCSDNDAVPNPSRGLTRVADGWVVGSATRAEVWVADPLFTGYNELTILLYDSLTDRVVTDAQITLKPLMEMMDKSHSCPVENPSLTSHNAYVGAVMFTMPSSEAGTWTLAVDVQRSNGKTGTVRWPVIVEKRSPSPLIVFKTETEEKFLLAAHFPNRPKIGVNPFEIIAFRSDVHSFEPVETLHFTMHTEMPSMDHGSPNNVDPAHDRDGHYAGQANFTMSGDWRIHLEITQSGAPLENKYFDVVVK